MENLSKRAIASRANGAKSRGPKSAAGRQRSSLNAIRHGYLSKCVVLDSEDKDTFKAHHEHYIQTFNPTDGVEHDLVDEMVASAWRLGRRGAVETALFDKVFEKSPNLAGAFSDLATGKEFELVHRYQSSVHRMFQRSFKNLILLRQFKAQEGNEPEEDSLPNEPEQETPNEPRSAQEPVESSQPARTISPPSLRAPNSAVPMDHASSSDGRDPASPSCNSQPRVI